MEKQQTPRNAQDAIAQANRFDRAQKIIEEGYSFSFDALTESVAVCKPGRLAASYWITSDGCDCPDRMRTAKPCKHEYAWKLIQSERADEEKMWESICKQWDEENAWCTPDATRLQRMRNLLLAELTDAENRAARLNAEPFASKTAVRSWADKAYRCRIALKQFDETICKVQIGLLTL